MRNPKLSSPKSPPSKPKKRYKWKRKPKKNAAWYAQWSAAQTHCHCCGIEQEEAAQIRFPGLSTHHIVKTGRVHTPTNVIRLCQRCHDCAEGLDTPVWLPDGTKWYYPKLSLANVLWMKARRAPEEFDRVRLRQIHMRPLPDEEAPHMVYLAEYVHWQRGNHLAVETVLRGSDFPGDLNALLGARMQPK